VNTSAQRVGTPAGFEYTPAVARRWSAGFDFVENPEVGGAGGGRAPMWPFGVPRPGSRPRSLAPPGVNLHRLSGSSPAVPMATPSMSDLLKLSICKGQLEEPALAKRPACMAVSLCGLSPCCRLLHNEQQFWALEVYLAIAKHNTRCASSHTRTPWAGAPLLLQRPGWVLLCMPRALAATPKWQLGLVTGLQPGQQNSKRKLLALSPVNFL
jgi:hypothetical protein